MFRVTTETVDHGESKPLLTELLFEEMLQYCQKSGAARSTKHCMSFLGAFLRRGYEVRHEIFTYTVLHCLHMHIRHACTYTVFTYTVLHCLQ